MKTQKVYNLFRDIKAQVIAGVLLAALTSTVAFAWNTNTRLTRLETALISLAQDVHDIKALLEKRGH